jgi:hypothetical protein
MVQANLSFYIHGKLITLSFLLSYGRHSKPKHLDGCTMQRIPLTLLPLAVARRTGKPGPSYRMCYFAALEGRIPAERGENGRWTVATSDISQAVTALSRGSTSPTATT